MHSLADNTIAYWKTQENLMKNYQEIREFHELSECSIQTCKNCTFMTNRLGCIREEKTPFTKAIERDKNKLKICKIYKNKMLTKNLKEDLNKLKNIVYSWIEELIIIMLIFLKLLYSFNMILIKWPVG